MRSFVRTALWAALGLGAVVGVLRATAIRWWRVPSDDPYLEASIAPTLRGGDLLILWRLTKPAVGDLVLCPEPSPDGGAAPDRIVIGRIVAEGGDSVSVKDARVHVNHDPIPSESACPELTFLIDDPETSAEVEQHCAMERIGSTVHMVGTKSSELKKPLDQAEVEVNSGQVWLASDNRYLPYDSRDYGAVDRDTCTETVIFRLVSAAGYFDVNGRLDVIH